MKKNLKSATKYFLFFFIGLFFCCQDDEITNTAATQVTTNQTEVTLDPGKTVQLTATVIPENAGNKMVFWKSNNEKIATVDNGLITAKSPGSVTILALAYSNTDARSEIIVTVTGIPEDLAAELEGNYIGNVTMSGMPIATDVEASLTPIDNKLWLATNAVTPLGTLSMDIEVDVQPGDNGHRIAGTGISSMGAVSVAGTVDDKGEMILTITLSDAKVDVVFTAIKGQTAAEILTGVYNGTVVIPMLGNLPDVELTFTPENKVLKLKTTVEIPQQGTLEMDIPMTAARAGKDFTVSGTGMTELFGSVSINGTVSATGAIDLTIHIDVNGLDVTYTGQKLEDLAAIIAGTYIGTVSAQGMGPITENDVAMSLTAIKLTTVHWATKTTTPLGEFEVTDFALTVVRSNDDFEITGTGNSSVGPLDVTGKIEATGRITLTMTGAALPAIITYEGQKQ